MNSLTPEGVYYNPSDLYHWLRQQESLPSWVQRKPDELTTGGEYNMAKHELTVRPMYQEGFVPEPQNLAHEMTHAAQGVLRKAAVQMRERQWQGETLSPKELQFLAAYQQMFRGLPGRMGQYEGSAKIDELTAAQRAQVNALADKRTQERWQESPGYKSYRIAPSELQAWGVGGSVRSPHWRIYGEVENNMQGHLNPTMATEFEMLRGLYDQLPEATRKASRIKPNPSPGAVTDYLNPFVK